MTGMRRGELAGLEWKDIDYEKNTISINRTGAYCKNIGIYTKEPKTAGSIRVITVSEIVIKQLKEYQEWYNINKANWGDRWIDSDRLFVQEHGEPICPNTIRFWLNKMLVENGMPHITVHSLRHTNITMQIAAGLLLQLPAEPDIQGLVQQQISTPTLLKALTNMRQKYWKIYLQMTIMEAKTLQ